MLLSGANQLFGQCSIGFDQEAANFHKILSRAFCSNKSFEIATLEEKIMIDSSLFIYVCYFTAISNYKTK